MCIRDSISTRPNLIHHAKELGLITVQRFFLLDSISFENVVRQSSHADVIDILPGAMPDVIRRLSQRVTQPLIASGLLTDKRDVCGALAALSLIHILKADDPPPWAASGTVQRPALARYLSGLRESDNNTKQEDFPWRQRPAS